MSPEDRRIPIGESVFAGVVRSARLSREQFFRDRGNCRGKRRLKKRRCRRRASRHHRRRLRRLERQVIRISRRELAGGGLQGIIGAAADLVGNVVEGAVDTVGG